MTAAIKLRRVVENTLQVLSIEAMASAQAIDLLAPLKTSTRGQAAHSAIRAVCATMDKDRIMYPDFARIAKLIETGKISAVLD
jgi:histidine ammonia-lyase